MSRIAKVDPAQATGRPKELLDKVQAALGATPNMTTTMASSAVLEGWLGLLGALSGGSIKADVAERIALAVAQANECSYCLSAHTYLGTNVAKLGAEEIERARRFSSANSRVAATLRFAETVLVGRGAVSQADFDAARAAGLSDTELAETVGHVALNVLTNYFNRAFAVEVDFPVVEAGPQALAA